MMNITTEKNQCVACGRKTHRVVSVNGRWACASAPLPGHAPKGYAAWRRGETLEFVRAIPLRGSEAEALGPWGFKLAATGERIASADVPAEVRAAAIKAAS